MLSQWTWKYFKYIKKEWKEKKSVYNSSYLDNKKTNRIKYEEKV